MIFDDFKDEIGNPTVITPDDIVKSGVQLATIQTLETARRFLFPVPKMDKNAPGVEYIGNKEASDWIPDPESGEYVETKFRLKDKGTEHGFGFLNPKDNSDQFVAVDGQAFIIVPNLTDENAVELTNHIKSLGELDKLSVADIRNAINKAAELQLASGEAIADVYDTNAKWVGKGVEGNQGNVVSLDSEQHGFGQHTKRGRELEAVLVEGTVFKGSATDHSLSFVVLKEDGKWRASQTDVFLKTYKQTSGELFTADKIDSQLPVVKVGELILERVQDRGKNKPPHLPANYSDKPP